MIIGKKIFLHLFQFHAIPLFSNFSISKNVNKYLFQSKRRRLVFTKKKKLQVHCCVISYREKKRQLRVTCLTNVKYTLHCYQIALLNRVFVREMKKDLFHVELKNISLLNCIRTEIVIQLISFSLLTIKSPDFTRQTYCTRRLFEKKWSFIFE